MRILIVSQYFWPENFRINDLAAELVRRGHTVTVLTGQPNYPDGILLPDYAADPGAFLSYKGAELIRVPLVPRGKGGMRLALNYLSYALTASTIGLWRLRGRKFDATFVFQGSPVTVGLPAIAIKWAKKTPIALWVLDLWPQSLEAVGAVKSPILLGFVDWLVTFIYRNCDRVLGQSRAFLPELGRHVQTSEKLGYLPSWSDTGAEQAYAAPVAEVPAGPDLFNIVFTGNIGEAQNMPAVLEAAVLLRDAPVRWIIVGDGSQAQWMRDEVARRNLCDKVTLPGRFPLDRMPSFFAHADALLVTLKTSPAFAMTIPGKVQSYMSAGKPILAMLDGEGAAIIQEAKAGYAVPSGHSVALAEAVRKMMALSAEDRDQLGQNGKIYADREFDRTRIIDQIEEILEAIGRTGAGRSNPRPAKQA